MPRLFSYSRDSDYETLNSSGWISRGVNTVVLLLLRPSTEAVVGEWHGDVILRLPRDTCSSVAYIVFTCKRSLLGELSPYWRQSVKS